MLTKKQNDDLLLTIKKCFIKLKYKKALNVHEPKLEKKDFKNIFDAMKSNILSIEGPKNKKLVAELKKKIGSENITLTNTGTSALDICFKVLNLDKWSEVLVPSFTFVASVNCIVYNSCIPHFIEIDEKTLAIDPAKLSDYLKKILKYSGGEYKNKNTGNAVKAILVVHPYGYPCDILKVKKIATEYNLKIIEDSAECFGSYVNHKHLGTYGDVGVLSFNGNKIVTSAQGGAIIASNSKYDARVKKYINLFKENKRQRDIFISPSYNYKLSNFNSALVLAQVQRLNKIISDKKKLNFYYHNYFKNCADDNEIFKT
jgi:perosamine synthetase